MIQPSAHEMHDPRKWLSYVPQTLADISPLYAHLYQSMQDDPELLTLLRLIDPDQPIPVLFFSVVSFLVLGEKQHPFAQFYPYLCPTPRSAEEAYPSFRAFCLAHRDELQTLLPTVRLQTNEVSRCAQLLPAFKLVFARGGYQPLALIEIGSSAGLNLNWHRYGYHYGEVVIGDRASPVQIHCRLLVRVFRLCRKSFLLLPSVTASSCFLLMLRQNMLFVGFELASGRKNRNAIIG